jgi:predicted dehydrogenase
LYSEFAQVVAARLAGRAPPFAHTLYPQVEDGVQGLAYVAAAVQSAQSGSWVNISA